MYILAVDRAALPPASIVRLVADEPQAQFLGNLDNQ
jgi:hypothetical protein